MDGSAPSFINSEHVRCVNEGDAMTRTCLVRTACLAIALAPLALPGAAALPPEESGDPFPLDPGAIQVNGERVGASRNASAEVRPCAISFTLCRVPPSSVRATAFVYADPSGSSTHASPHLFAAGVTAEGNVAGVNLERVGIVIGPFPGPPGCGFNCEPRDLIIWAKQVLDGVLP